MAKAVKKTSASILPKKIIKPLYVKPPANAYTINRGTSKKSLQWEAPEWDLAETGRILDTESLVSRAYQVKKSLFLKEGYEFISPTPERANYIEERIRQMERATKKAFPILLSETVSSLLRCSNAFWVKVRNPLASGGRIRTENGKRINPIAGYFLLPAETVKFKRDKKGNVLSYRQEIYNKDPIEFKPEEVVHFYFNKREGFSIGTPDIVSVKADIRALRRIEENVELLIYQHLFPLFHYQVGTENAPAGMTADGKNEVEIARYEVARMPTDGCWVTSERHKIEAIQASSPPLNVEKVIEHFKSRIYIGLGVSSVDMGEGGTASRSTAMTLSRNLVDTIKELQRHFGALFFSEIITELLAESDFSVSDLYSIENIVTLKFKEIDIETQMAKENHLTDLYLKNVLTHDEVRLGMGRQPFEGEGWPTGTKKSQMFQKGEGDWSRTNYGIIERDKVILQSLDEPGTDASAAEMKSRTTANAQKSAGGSSVSNKNQPANQNGSRTSAKLNKDFILDGVIKTVTFPVEDYYKQIKEDIVNRIKLNGYEGKIIKTNLDVAFTESTVKLKRLCRQAFINGLDKSNVGSWEINLNHFEPKIYDHVDLYINKLKSDLYSKIEEHSLKNKDFKQEDSVLVSMVFDTFEHRTRMIDNSEIMRAYNYGLIIGYKQRGFTEVSSIASENACDRCKSTILKYKFADVIIYEELPPHYPHCLCTMKVTQP